MSLFPSLEEFAVTPLLQRGYQTCSSAAGRVTNSARVSTRGPTERTLKTWDPSSTAVLCITI